MNEFATADANAALTLDITQAQSHMGVYVCVWLRYALMLFLCVIRSAC